MRLGRWIFGGLFVAAGVAHFVVPALYETAIPERLPAHRTLVLVSGAAEIAGGVGLQLARTRRPAAWGLILLLVAVFPANIWMAQHPDRFHLPVLALWLRLPLQLPLIYWAWRYTRADTIKG